MMNWRLAESLKQLRRQLDTNYPDRSKISDGAIGNAEHASRASDHNPWVKDKSGSGVVTAIDITHDTGKGIDCRKLLKSLLSSGDSRIKYIIFDRFIYSAIRNFVPKAYHGANAHRHHLHISVSADERYFDSTDKWNV